MVKEIRIYAEGGGQSNHTKRFLREGFSTFLGDLRLMARDNDIAWDLVACGSREAAYDHFRTAMQQHPDAFKVLLVDSEAPVQLTPWAHLRQLDGWANHGAHDDHCHLMTQAMEAWFVADVPALATFYGHGFRQNRISRNPDVEQIPKDRLQASLEDATRDSKKGEYHKTHHAHQLLRLINPAKVRVCFEALRAFVCHASG
jgi:hypothetical protein